MSTQQGDIVERAVNAALADIEEYAPQEFQKLQADPAKKQALIQAAREAAEEEVKLAEEFRTRPSENVAERLSKLLPQHRVDLIKTGLEVPTYQLDISKKADGKHWADITRDGKVFMQSQMLESTAVIGKSTYIQMASIVVEGVLLTLQAVGIKVAVSEQLIKRTAEETVSVIESSSALQKAVQALQEAVKGGSKWEVAKAIFKLIKDIKAGGILWKIIKGLCSNMTWYDWVKTAGIVTAMIVAAVATDGVALVAKIILALNSAYTFFKKFTKLDELAALSKDL